MLAAILFLQALVFILLITIISKCQDFCADIKNMHYDLQTINRNAKNASDLCDKLDSSATKFNRLVDMLNHEKEDGFEKEDGAADV